MFLKFMMYKILEIILGVVDEEMEIQIFGYF